MRDSVEEQARYSLSYRSAEAGQVMSWVKAGQCGCLVGLRGAGKSNFLRFLLREDTRRHYLRQSHADFSFVLLDLLSLSEHTPWAVCELMLDRMLNQLRPRLEDKIAEELAALQQEITHNNNLLSVQRAIERCIEVVCRLPPQRIVLLFDEFDGVFKTLDPSLFRYLRSLRDAHKGQLSYLIIAANDLASLRDDLTEVEHFYRLVSRNICGLGPYAEADARQMIHYLETQRATELRAGDTARLIEISGGHAGLLKAILSLLWETPHPSSLAEIILTLESDPRIQAECRKVWESLPEIEQNTLRALASRSQVKREALHHLKPKGLVREGSRMFSPLFAEFVRRQVPPSTRGFNVDCATGKVYIEGQLIKTLGGLELEMLCYLFNHRGRVCTKDEIAESVYHQRYGKGGVTDEMMQSLIYRLRKKIEPDLERPHYILAVRREGYKLVDSDKN